jgi:hypothetical protein
MQSIIGRLSVCLPVISSGDGRCVANVNAALLVVSIALLAISERAVANPIPYNLTTSGNNNTVDWGSTDPNARPIGDELLSNGTLDFYWTTNGTQNPGYSAFHTNVAGNYTFIEPNDPTLTDWHQTVSYNGMGSAVAAGAIKRNPANNQSPLDATGSGEWSFFSLDQLPDSGYEIPDFAAGGTTIYTAVDLLTYITDNPLGPLNGQYQIGDSLNGLGLSIVNGMMPGVSGIYFATTPFTFDPNSATGFVPEGGASAWLNSQDYSGTFGGDLATGQGLSIIGIHDATTPEPTTYSLFTAAGLLIALGKVRTRRWAEQRAVSRGISGPGGTTVIVGIRSSV